MPENKTLKKGKIFFSVAQWQSIKNITFNFKKRELTSLSSSAVEVKRYVLTDDFRQVLGSMSTSQSRGYQERMTMYTGAGMGPERAAWNLFKLQIWTSYEIPGVDIECGERSLVSKPSSRQQKATNNKPISSKNQKTTNTDFEIGLYAPIVHVPVLRRAG